MSEFAVDPVIAGLTQTIADWPLCRVFVYNDSRYHWGLLVPRRRRCRRDVRPVAPKTRPR